MGDLHRAIMPGHALTLCVLIGLVALLDTANGLQLNVITPVVGYGMKGEDADVDVTVELPSIDTPGAMVPHSEAKAWKWLCDCETDCEVPRDSTFYSGTNSC